MEGSSTTSSVLMTGAELTTHQSLDLEARGLQQEREAFNKGERRTSRRVDDLMADVKSMHLTGLNISAVLLCIAPSLGEHVRIVSTSMLGVDLPGQSSQPAQMALFPFDSRALLKQSSPVTPSSTAPVRRVSMC